MEYICLWNFQIFASMTKATIAYFLATISISTLKNSAALQAAHESKYLSYTLADEFRQTSADLTSLCRSYIATGDKKHFDAYWDIVHWRAGETARPAYVHQKLYRGEVKKQSDIMVELGFSATEMVLLDDASIAMVHLKCL